MKMKVEDKGEVFFRQYPYVGVHASGVEICFLRPGEGYVTKDKVSGKSLGRFFANEIQESEFTPITQLIDKPGQLPKIIPVKDRLYPYVGEYRDKSFKVLFTSHGNGIVIETESVTHSYFMPSNLWIEDGFTPIPVQRIIIEF